MGWDGMGWDGQLDGMGWDGMGWDGMGSWMGWDGMGWLNLARMGAGTQDVGPCQTIHRILCGSRRILAPLPHLGIHQIRCG